MSYCRFENTSTDLDDCVDAINSGALYDDLSDYERRGLKRILNLAKEIVLQEAHILECVDRDRD